MVITRRCLRELPSIASMPGPRTLLNPFHVNRFAFRAALKPQGLYLVNGLALAAL